jgi:hypothetical protein
MPPLMISALTDSPIEFRSSAVIISSSTNSWIFVSAIS